MCVIVRALGLILLLTLATADAQLKCTLELSSEPHMVDFILVNTDASDVAVLRWDLPFDNRFGGVDPFSVFLSGERIPYVGVRVKYAEPIFDDYIYIRSNQSLVVSVDLRDLYDMSKVGNYKVALEAIVFDFVKEADFGSVPRTRDSFISINIASSPVFYTVSDTKVPRTVGAPYPCSSSELSTIRNAASNYVTLINRAVTVINSGNTAYYLEWFGAYTSSRYATAQEVLSTSQSNTVVAYACDSRAGVYAYVYPSDRTHTIYLCDAFWPARVIGSYDSQSGTLLHELSHFSDIGGTNDWVYGTSGARNLARSNPDRAVNNADNFEYFCESQFV